MPALRLSPLTLGAFGANEILYFPCQSRAPVLVDGPTVHFEKLHVHSYP